MAVTDHRQHAVEGQGDERRDESDQPPEQRHHQRQEGHARDRLDEPGQGQDRPSQPRVAGGGDAERHADDDPYHQRRHREQQVAGEQLRELGETIGQVARHVLFRSSSIMAASRPA